MNPIAAHRQCTSDANSHEQRSLKRGEQEAFAISGSHKESCNCWRMCLQPPIIDLDPARLLELPEEHVFACLQPLELADLNSKGHG